MLSRNYLLALVFLVTTGSFARALPTEEGECSKKTTCSKCIGYAKENCVWCSNLKNMQLAHCQNENYSDKNWCADEIEKSHDEITYTTSDLPKQHIWFEDRANTPSKSYIKTRVGVPKTLDVTYKIGKDFIVDFYFLLDLSVRKGGGKIHYLNEAGWNTIRSLNNDVHIGLGTFIDKPVPPYGSPESDIPEKFTNSNIPNYLLGPKPYSYKNMIRLTNKTGDAVGLPDANTKGIKGRSLDDRQGTLDALMQVMVCEGTEGVGWRQEALHIIIVVTDKPYHSAGDGKMAGAGLRNDMQCHINDPSIATTQDYPSVGQINKVARDKNFIIVFAVDSGVRETYELLSKAIEGSVVQQTSDLHRDLQAITKNAYEEILKCPQIFIKAPGNITVTLDPQCNTAVRKQECMITEEESKQIKATVNITECIQGTQNVELQVMGFTSKVVLDIESSCVCNCMKDNQKKEKSPDEKCNNKGDFRCGVCECYSQSQSLGPDCNQCSRNEETCKVDATAATCSGRGRCSCGKCFGCVGSSGKFCEFTDDMCDLPDQVPKCSGPDHGSCFEGKCVCLEPYIGKDCSCRNDNSTCVGPNKLVCSGNGGCNCGKCECNILDKTTIPNNDYCDYIRCDNYSELAMCLHNTDDPKDCSRKHPPEMEFEYTLVNKSDMAKAQSGRMEQCNMKNKNGKGILVFRYKFTEPPFKLVLKIQNELDTPVEPNIPLTVGIAVGTVVMVGMLTAIIWKYTVDFIDAKEYKAFRKELENLEFEETNPLYRDATTKTKNPTFRLSFKFKRNSSVRT